MTFSPEQIAALEAPLLTDNIKKNPRGFDYIEGWRAIAEANRIFGYGEWDRLTEELRQLGEPHEVKGNQRVAYFARVRIIVRGQGGAIITRDGCGYGSGIDKDIGQAHESAIKESETDAMKRALMTFGNPFGLALYQKPTPNGERDNVAAPQSQAATLAIAKLNDANTAADFKETWGRNKDGWKEVLSGEDYARVVSVMKSVGIVWATREKAAPPGGGHAEPPPTDFTAHTPFDDDLSVMGDDRVPF